MKIGIISLNMYTRGLNFACPLHSWAFQQFLRQHGIDSTVLSYKPVYYEDFDLKHPYDYYRERYQNWEKKSPISKEEKQLRDEKLEYLGAMCREWKKLYRDREIRYDKFQKFIDDNYVKTDICYDSDLLEVMDPGFDCYICVTDVIWKSEPGYGFDRGFFLGSSCMENKWKIAYSGSRNVWKARTKEEESLFFHYLADMDHISVREESLKKYIEENSGQKAVHVLDPVLLHEKEFYESFMIKPAEEHYLLLYYVYEQSRDTIAQAVNYAKAHHMKIVEITDRAEDEERFREFGVIDKIYRYDVGIEEWLGYIRFADVVFTNSFHACCFSVLFEKNFFVGKRAGDKLPDFLKWMGLSERRFCAKDMVADHEPPGINYEAVRERLAALRGESADYILRAIRDVQGRKRPPKDYETFKRSLTYKLCYNNHVRSDRFTWTCDETQGVVEKTQGGTLEFSPYRENADNSGNTRFEKNMFHLDGYRFRGWTIRFRLDHHWFVYLDDGTLRLREEYREGTDPPLKIFAEGDCVPYLPVNRIAVMIADAVWKKTPAAAAGELLDRCRRKLRRAAARR